MINMLSVIETFVDIRSNAHPVIAGRLFPVNLFSTYVTKDNKQSRTTYDVVYQGSDFFESRNVKDIDQLLEMSES